MLLASKIIKVFIKIFRKVSTFLFKIQVDSRGRISNVSFPFYLINPHLIKVGKNFSSGPRLRIEAWTSYRGNKYSPRIVIGDNVSVNHNLHVGAINMIVIGDNALIGSNVLITDHSHGDLSLELTKTYQDLPLHSKGPVIIEENVWIGENVAIMPNVRIGKNSVIGANSVVVSDVPPCSIVAGIPVRLIKSVKYKEV